MKTEQQILNRIKEDIERYWKYTRQEDKTGDKYRRLMIGLDSLLWVLYDYSHKNICPYCGSIMECDTVSVGIGHVQCGPYHCEDCGASEIHWEDSLQLDEDEKLTGFYKNRISPMANTCCGALVSHEEAERLYPYGILDNCKPDFK